MSYCDISRWFVCLQFFIVWWSTKQPTALTPRVKSESEFRVFILAFLVGVLHANPWRQNYNRSKPHHFTSIIVYTWHHIPPHSCSVCGYPFFKQYFWIFFTNIFQIPTPSYIECHPATVFAKTNSLNRWRSASKPWLNPRTRPNWNNFHHFSICGCRSYRISKHARKFTWRHVSAI